MDDYNRVEIVTIDDSTSSEEEEEEIDLNNCNWLMTSKITVEDKTSNPYSTESPYVPRDVPGKTDFFWNGLDPHKDELLINARKRPPGGHWMCGFCYHWTKTKAELSAHMHTVHVPEAKFHVCKICKARYVTKFLLERHEETHKYRPTLPNWRYVDSTGVPVATRVTNHYLNGIRPPRPTKEALAEAGAIFKRIAYRKASCSACSEEFDNIEQSKEHYLNTHATMYCRLCPADEPPNLYLQLTDLKTHLIEDHALSYLQYYTDTYSKLWKTVAIEKRFKDPVVASSFVQFFHTYAAKPPSPVVPMSPIPEPCVELKPQNELEIPVININPQKLNAEGYEKVTNVTKPKKRRQKQTPSDEPLGEPGRKCYVCKKQVAYKDYDAHFNAHTELKHACTAPGCKKRFLKKTSLQLHARAHADDRAFVCHLCPRGYNYSSLLKRHLRTHTGEMPYECDSCDRKFYELVSLNYHTKKVHTGERPHKCHLCSKAFILANDLKKHIIVHQRTDSVVVEPSPSSPVSVEQDDKVDDDAFQIDLDLDIEEVGLDGDEERVTFSRQAYRGNTIWNF